MADNINISIDSREFEAALRDYAVQSKRDFADIMNKKAYYIARRALWATHKADRVKMAAELGEAKLISVSTRGKTKGKFKKGGKSLYTSSLIEGLAAASLRKSGSEITRDSLLKKMRQIAGARIRSIAFLKSGWLPSIKKLASLVKGKGGLPPIEGKEVGASKKGYAIPAVIGWNPAATVANKANAKRDNKRALIRWGLPAMRQAVIDETASTVAETERRMAQTAAKYSAR